MGTSPEGWGGGEEKRYVLDGLIWVGMKLWGVDLKWDGIG